MLGCLTRSTRTVPVAGEHSMNSLPRDVMIRRGIQGCHNVLGTLPTTNECQSLAGVEDRIISSSVNMSKFLSRVICVADYAESSVAAQSSSFSRITYPSLAKL